MSEPTSSSRTVKLETLLQVLQNGQIEVQGLLPNGSNYTFFAMVSRGDDAKPGLARSRDNCIRTASGVGPYGSIPYPF